MLSAIAMMGLWWAISLALTFVTWPAIARLFPFNCDRGYAIARAIAAPIVGYLVFLLVFAGIVENGEAAHVIALCILAICSLVLFLTKPRVSARTSLRPVVKIEAVFVIVFILSTLMRSRNPQVEGLEKFMNFGFINSIYFTPSFPPPDPWFSGEPINYYYFGHMSAATMIRLTGLPLDVGYNLAFAHVLASFAAAMTSLAWDMLSRVRRASSAALF